TGVRTLAQLGRLPATHKVPQLAQPSFDKLREQAAMQLAGRETGQLQYRVIDHGAGVPRGFGLLPAPDAADVYFDMEGDPLYSPSPTPGASAGDGGLEYLFGVLYHEQDAAGGFAPEWTFKSFWGHGRDEERRAFEAFMDWLAARIARHPALHVYHYAAYEDSALKRLSARHATREALLDQLLRAGRLVDLYKVVREGLRCSTPSYSIKYIEKFYRGAREGEVTTAGASIVYYERWLETREPQLLADIERYNEDDVRSLQQLHAWLQSIQPHIGGAAAGGHDGNDAAEMAAQGTSGAAPADRAPLDGQPSQALQQYLQDVAAVREPLLATLPADRSRWTAQHAARALLADLLEFHRRCEKPQWWEMFARTTLSFEELLDSVDAVAGLARVPGDAVGEYAFPAQELKFEAGEYAIWLEHPQLATVRILEIDEERRRLRLAPTRRSGPLPDTLSLGKGGPIDAMVLKQALLRVGRSVVARDQHYRALEALLEKRSPKLTGHKRGQPVVADLAAPLEQVIEAVSRLDDSHLFIQGPPGAGKTYTASHVIAALLRAGKRVAVSSNSHKAINNLLAAVEEVVLRDSAGTPTLRACKKVSRQDESTCLHGLWICDVDDVDEALSRRWQLVGGTAWLFARPEADQQFDYLFVDEAGQVALGNLAAMATCARNLVLLGDQMQLSQPIQGVHPGRSGESTLDFLLDGRATVPPELGIFLPQTWRMGPDVCRFISEAIYDGRLEPEPKNANQRLVLGPRMHPALRPSGVVFWPVEHAGCAQRSEEEAEEIRRIYTSLLGGAVDPTTGATLSGASWIDRDGVKRRLTAADVLVVAPYNLQVNLLRRVLPRDARVGTVDKFQGQEAAVSIVSMTTSSEDELPRNLEFLFSRNRLNVAISRARCLSIVVASPRLLDTRCRTPEQIALVNLLCWAAEA
ncbi:MAG TPA: TM0106 family RecB-like putative nuclease, partial [Steroidobacteraceae bacterium]|nr:TM0106 family RecB-like putative nuclease [Steroidobacteraceae bacterium]